MTRGWRCYGCFVREGCCDRIGTQNRGTQNTDTLYMDIHYKFPKLDIDESKYSQYAKTTKDAQLAQLPTTIQYCKKCVISNQRPRTDFNEDGICNACKYAEKSLVVVSTGMREKKSWWRCSTSIAQKMAVGMLWCQQVAVKTVLWWRISLKLNMACTRSPRRGHHLSIPTSAGKITTT